MRELVLAGADTSATDNQGKMPGQRFQLLSYLRLVNCCTGGTVYGALRRFVRDRSIALEQVKYVTVFFTFARCRCTTVHTVETPTARRLSQEASIDADSHGVSHLGDISVAVTTIRGVTVHCVLL